MCSLLFEKFFRLREMVAEGDLRNLFRNRVFFNRIAIPACMDLAALKIPVDSGKNSNYKFLELTQEDIRIRTRSFAMKSRALRATRNLKKGFRGFAILEGQSVVGDLWCITPDKSGNCISHPDLGILGVTCEENEAYAFDMHIETSRRGKNLAAPLQRFLHSVLKEEGIRRVYGFYWADNIPALWMHRMLKFKELPKRKVSRFFFLQKSRDAAQ
jgi:hypothetical protein